MKHLCIAAGLSLCLATSLFGQAQLGGVGISLAMDKDTKEFSVHKVIPGSPAAKTGISTGLVIHAINGVAATGKSVEEIVRLLRGPLGSMVDIEFIDRDAKKTNKVELERVSIAALQAANAAKIGDPAAPLKITEWVKGGPVDLSKRDKIYVVEFWATWCGPCRTSIPHLTELQKKFASKDVVFVGISAEKPSVVKPFVEKMGDRMDYVVACDDERQTNSGYMEAYGRNGIPSAFIVDRQGKVAWAGHPMAGLESKLAELTK
jgi:thiol-disulfide isomerase/thioredoxin